MLGGLFGAAALGRSLAELGRRFSCVTNVRNVRTVQDRSPWLSGAQTGWKGFGPLVNNPNTVVPPPPANAVPKRHGRGMFAVKSSYRVQVAPNQLSYAPSAASPILASWRERANVAGTPQVEVLALYDHSSSSHQECAGITLKGCGCSLPPLAAPADLHARGACWDITELKQAEAALSRNEANLGGGPGSGADRQLGARRG